MKLRAIVSGIGLVAATALITSQVVSQDSKYTPTPEEQKMMEQWQMMSEQNEEHTFIQKRVGKWNYTCKFRMAPDGEWTESTGQINYKPVFGGLFVASDFEGVGPDGSTFNGMGVSGYDNLKKKHISFWIDSMSSGFMISEGSRSGNTITFNSEGSDPKSGGTKTWKTTERVFNDDKWEMAMFDKTPDSKEFKSFVLEMTRAGQKR